MRFAPEVDIVDPAADEQSHESLAAKDITILLVEDNPVSVYKTSENYH